MCHCDSWYMSQMSQCLQDRICQHVPKSIQNRTGQEGKQPECQVNQLILYQTVTCQLEIMCYTNKNVHLIATTINFLFFLKQDPMSIYLS